MNAKPFQKFLLFCSVLAFLFAPGHAYARDVSPRPIELTQGEPEKDSGLLANWEVRIAFPNNQPEAIWTGYVARYQNNVILEILSTHEIDITQDCNIDPALHVSNEIAYFQGANMNCQLPDYKRLLTSMLAKYNGSPELEDIVYGFAGREKTCDCQFTGPPWAAAHVGQIPTVLAGGIGSTQNTIPLLSVTGNTPGGLPEFIIDFQIETDKQNAYSHFDFIGWPGKGKSSPLIADNSRFGFTKLWSGYEPNFYVTANQLLAKELPRPLDFLADTNFANNVSQINNDQFVAWAENSPMVVEHVEYDSSAWNASTMTDITIGQGLIKEIRFDPGCRGF